MSDLWKDIGAALKSGSVHPTSRSYLTRQLALIAEAHADEQIQAWARARRDAGQPRAEWVLVQGCHDSGTIDGVLGPYTEAHADWLLAGPLASSYSNWTKVKLSSGPEGT